MLFVSFVVRYPAARITVLPMFRSFAYYSSTAVFRIISITMGGQYAAPIALVYDRAKKRGIAQEMPTEWFSWFQR